MGNIEPGTISPSFATGERDINGASIARPSPCATTGPPTETLNLAPAFSCNCILNYVYGRLEGAQFIPVPGPATFGEILLNQTLVYLTIKEK